MSKNKYPEKSRELILNTAKKLFLEKGFDNTSIKDIVDNLGGMTKGAIYHHFKSKMDILNSIIDNNESSKLLNEEWKGNNGLEKIQYMMIESLKDYKKLSSLYSMEISFKSPSILSEQYNVSFELLIPKLKKIIDEAIEDGSIITDYPEEIAELIITYFNFIIGLRIKELNKEQLNNKFNFIKEVFDKMDIPLISDDILKNVNDLSMFIENLKNKN